LDNLIDTSISQLSQIFCRDISFQVRPWGERKWAFAMSC